MVGGRSDLLDVFTKREGLVECSREGRGVKAVLVGLISPVVAGLTLLISLTSWLSVGGGLLLLNLGTRAFLTDLSELLFLGGKGALLLIDDREVSHLVLEDSCLAHRKGVGAKELSNDNAASEHFY